jgi:hypothetical protein
LEINGNARSNLRHELETTMEIGEIFGIASIPPNGTTTTVE